MKKILVLLLILVTIGCYTPKYYITYVEDTFRPNNSYYYTEWITLYSELIPSNTPSYRDTLKVMLRGRRDGSISLIADFETTKSITTLRSDSIILRDSTGKEINLSYQSRISSYDGKVVKWGDGYQLKETYNIKADTKLNDLGILTAGRISYNGVYRNFEINEYRAIILNKLYNEMKKAVNGEEYSEFVILEDN